MSIGILSALFYEKRPRIDDQSSDLCEPRCREIGKAAELACGKCQVMLCRLIRLSLRNLWK